MATHDEPTPVRDVGPYKSREQASAQFQALTFDIPPARQAPGFASELVLMEALLISGVQVSGWEDVQRQEIIRALNDETVQMIAGWIMRAHHAGRTGGQPG